MQLHGTGLHYKTHLGGRHGVLRQFPHIEEQIQIQVKDYIEEQTQIQVKDYIVEQIQIQVKVG